jgi:phospholipase/carboxylesterase
MITTNHFKSHFIPSARASKRLMIVLHGKGDSLRPFKKFNEELDLTDMNFLLLNAPKKFLGGYSWYGEPPYLKQGVARIREKLLQLLRDLESQGWDSKNIFLLGFSQGCLVSADLALHWPKKLGGVIGVSGYFEFFPYWKKRLTNKVIQTPWMFTHGNKDDVLPLVKTRQGAEKLKSVGFNVEWTELEKDHVFVDEDYPLIRKWVKTQVRNQSAY